MILAHLDHWHHTTKKPVLWADGAKNQPATDSATGRPFIRNDGHWYADILRDQLENPNQENLDLITTAHRETTNWATAFQ